MRDATPLDDWQGNYVILVGDVVDGFTPHGPFNDPNEEVDDYVAGYLRNEEWTLSKLHDNRLTQPPAEQEEEQPRAGKVLRYQGDKPLSEQIVQGDLRVWADEGGEAITEIVREDGQPIVMATEWAEKNLGYRELIATLQVMAESPNLLRATQELLALVEKSGLEDPAIDRAKETLRIANS